MKYGLHFNECNSSKDGTSEILVVRYYNHFREINFNNLASRLVS